MRGNIRFLPVEKALLRDSLGGVSGSFSAGHFNCAFLAKTSTGLRTSETKTLDSSSGHDVAGGVLRRLI